ncbi:hypothetical protein DSO57_1008884 [Entomophthora muscae]|uniref:Uncharacterized protein n=1 Tax=Entomophthora muscae TaxID=34485 RepID=A0ACC2RY75_9FUNG|nr:hypothetical protein DSO57_1008884 [Entomophthora muscae]
MQILNIFFLCGHCAFLRNSLPVTDNPFYQQSVANKNKPIDMVFGGDHVEVASGQGRGSETTSQLTYDFSNPWLDSHLAVKLITDFTLLPCGINYRGPESKEDDCDMKLRVLNHTIKIY